MFLNDQTLEQIKDYDIVNNTFQNWQNAHHLAVNCFAHNLKIEHVIIPNTINQIGNGCFMKCTNLKKVVLPNTISSLPSSCFLGCSKLEDISIPNTVQSLEAQSFEGCYRLKTIQLPNSVTSLGHRCFANCISLKELILPDNIETIGTNALFDCESLKYVSAPKSTGSVGNLIAGTNFNYYYENTKENRIYFSQNLPTNTQDVTNIFDISKCKNAYYSFDNYVTLFVRTPNKEDIFALAKILEERKFKLPYTLIDAINDKGLLKNFIKNSHFKFFQKETEFFKDELESLDDYFIRCFYTFALVLGCFNSEKMHNKFGNETDVFVYQKATNILVEMYKKNMFKDMSILNNITKKNLHISQDFINFLSYKEGKNGYVNLDLMNELENFAPGNFLRIMENFEKVKEYKVYIDEKGLPKKRTWKDAIQKFLTQKQYKHVQEKDKSLAELFSIINMGQIDFEQAVKIREDAKKSEVKAHILNKELKEDTILESIQKIKNQTQELLINSKQIIDELYSKQFTYEMLDKFDDKNFVLGSYTNCCVNINSIFYGSEITRFSVIDKNVQTMIVKNYKGDIIAKGTIYVNENQGYAVINDFEINYKYKQNEKFGIPGYYKDNKESSQRHERDLIFSAFMRGIKAFVEEYDKQHINNPIRQVNVGRGNNKLQEQLDNFENSENILFIPDNYKFMDARESQVVLYKRPPEHEELNK